MNVVSSYLSHIDTGQTQCKAVFDIFSSSWAEFLSLVLLISRERSGYSTWPMQPVPGVPIGFNGINDTVASCADGQDGISSRERVVAIELEIYE